MITDLFIDKHKFKVCEPVQSSMHITFLALMILNMFKYNFYILFNLIAYCKETF